MASAPDTCLDHIDDSVPWVRWAFSVRVVHGWGNPASGQRSTAGWLAALPVLEPHWQVMVSHGLATGYIEWGPGRRLDFEEAPFYSEKNWGDGFPQKWGWLQCNTFSGMPDLALTAVGARRNLLNVPGLNENVGLLGIHFGGAFVELEPASGDISWQVRWGKWRFAGKNDEYEAVAEATCNKDGQVLRAPTGATGLIPACKDSFAGACSARHLLCAASVQHERVVPALQPRAMCKPLQCHGHDVLLPLRLHRLDHGPLKSLEMTLQVQCMVTCHRTPVRNDRMLACWQMMTQARLSCRSGALASVAFEAVGHSRW